MKIFTILIKEIRLIWSKKSLIPLLVFVSLSCIGAFCLYAFVLKALANSDNLVIVKSIVTAFAAVASIIAIYENFKDEKTNDISGYGFFYACLLAFVYSLSGLLEYEISIRSESETAQRFGEVQINLQNTANSLYGGIDSLQSVNKVLVRTVEAAEKGIDTTSKLIVQVGSTAFQISKQIKPLPTELKENNRYISLLGHQLDTTGLLLAKVHLKSDSNILLTSRLLPNVEKLANPSLPLELDFTLQLILDTVGISTFSAFLKSKKLLNTEAGRLYFLPTEKREGIFPWDGKLKAIRRSEDDINGEFTESKSSINLHDNWPYSEVYLVKKDHLDSIDKNELCMTLNKISSGRLVADRKTKQSVWNGQFSKTTTYTIEDALAQDYLDNSIKNLFGNYYLMIKVVLQETDLFEIYSPKDSYQYTFESKSIVMPRELKLSYGTPAHRKYVPVKETTAYNLSPNDCFGPGLSYYLVLDLSAISF